MLHDTIARALNQQILLEGQSSHTYLTMAVWAETQGFDGVAEFLYAHSEEEREHMLKLMRFVNERGGIAQVPTVEAGPTEYGGLKEVFESILAHETRSRRASTTWWMCVCRPRTTPPTISCSGTSASKSKRKVWREGSWTSWRLPAMTKVHCTSSTGTF